MLPDTHSSTAIAVLQMHYILFYIVFARHTDFVLLLVRDMLDNVQDDYKCFEGIELILNKTRAVVASGAMTHHDAVVLFFFLLSVDNRMRHWILNAHEPPAISAKREAGLRRCIHLVPRGADALPHAVACPFLGQTVALNALQPQRAVSILTTLANEDFFMQDNNTTNTVDDIYNALYKLVLFS